MAHICPKKELPLFAQNQMGTYLGSEETTMDAPSNLIRLRAGIHWLWDQRYLIFVPRSSSLVAHVLAGDSELVQLYQNVGLQPLRGVAPEYLFARSAWALFSSITWFLQASVSLFRLLRTKDGQSAKDVFDSQCQTFVQVSSEASINRSRSSKLEPTLESGVEGKGSG